MQDNIHTQEAQLIFQQQERKRKARATLSEPPNFKSEVLPLLLTVCVPAVLLGVFTRDGVNAWISQNQSTMVFFLYAGLVSLSVTVGLLSRRLKAVQVLLAAQIDASET
jgi:undecaprenyl pyrophosphate phosphatase UppP